MSVLETLNPALAAHRRKLLCHSGEGFADPENAAVAIAAEDRAAPPRDLSAHEISTADREAAAAAPDPHRVRRPRPAPVNIHRRRCKWLRAKDATSV